MSNFAIDGDELIFIGEFPKNDIEAKVLVLEKWDILRETSVWRGLGGSTCAFCMLHKDCNGCPIFLVTKEKSCNKTPFYEYRVAVYTKSEVVMKLANDMYELVANLVIEEEE